MLRISHAALYFWFLAFGYVTVQNIIFPLIILISSSSKFQLIPHILLKEIYACISWSLIEEDVLPDGTKVAYYSRGQKLL
jgi:hypothetical protein